MIIKDLRLPNRKKNKCFKTTIKFPYLMSNCVNSYKLGYPVTGNIRRIFPVDRLYRFFPESNENSWGNTYIKKEVLLKSNKVLRKCVQTKCFKIANLRMNFDKTRHTSSEIRQ